MAFDPIKFQNEITKYSSLTRLMIALGMDAFTGIKALIGSLHKELTVEEQNAILAAIKANSEVRELMALAASGQLGNTGGTFGGNFTD